MYFRSRDRKALGVGREKMEWKNCLNTLALEAGVVAPSIAEPEEGGAVRPEMDRRREKTFLGSVEGERREVFSFQALSLAEEIMEAAFLEAARYSACSGAEKCAERNALRLATTAAWMSGDHQALGWRLRLPKGIAFLAAETMS